MCGYLNGHLGAAAEGIDWLHGVKRFGVRDVLGNFLLEFADAMRLFSSV